MLTWYFPAGNLSDTSKVKKDENKFAWYYIDMMHL